MEQKSISKALVAAVLVVIVGVIIFFLPKKQTTTSTVETTGSNASTSVETTPTATIPESSKYKDGTYTAMGSYNSPGGPDDVTLTVTLKGNIIIDSTLVNGSHDATSNRYQNMFISGYKQFVTGKNIDEVNLTKVSGSSLTGIGFNAALSKIKAQAKA